MSTKKKWGGGGCSVFLFFTFCLTPSLLCSAYSGRVTLYNSLLLSLYTSALLAFSLPVSVFFFSVFFLPSFLFPFLPHRRAAADDRIYSQSSASFFFSLVLTSSLEPLSPPSFPACNFGAAVFFFFFFLLLSLAQVLKCNSTTVIWCFLVKLLCFFFPFFNSSLWVVCWQPSFLLLYYYYFFFVDHLFFSCWGV